MHVCEGMVGKGSERHEVVAPEPRVQYPLTICSLDLFSKRAIQGVCLRLRS